MIKRMSFSIAVNGFLLSLITFTLHSSAENVIVLFTQSEVGVRGGSNDGVVTVSTSPLSHTLSSRSHTFPQKNENIRMTVVAQQSAVQSTKAVSSHLIFKD